MQPSLVVLFLLLPFSLASSKCTQSNSLSDPNSLPNRPIEGLTCDDDDKMNPGKGKVPSDYKDDWSQNENKDNKDEIICTNSNNEMNDCKANDKSNNGGSKVEDGKKNNKDEWNQDGKKHSKSGKTCESHHNDTTSYGCKVDPMPPPLHHFITATEFKTKTLFLNFTKTATEAVPQNSITEIFTTTVYQESTRPLYKTMLPPDNSTKVVLSTKSFFFTPVPSAMPLLVPLVPGAAKPSFAPILINMPKPVAIPRPEFVKPPPIASGRVFSTSAPLVTAPVNFNRAPAGSNIQHMNMIFGFIFSIAFLP